VNELQIEDPILIGIYILFVFSQSFFFVGNLVFVHFLLRDSNPVRTREDFVPRPVTVLIPIYNERKPIIEKTIDALQNIEYPTQLVSPIIIYEADDVVVSEYVDELPVESIAVTEGTPAWEQMTDVWSDGTPFPATKGRALTYAFFEKDFEGVITILDADTIIPDDLFQFGVAGLETYDIVQSKQTVENIDDGWLPLLEGMGMAAWSHNIYPRTATGPYQLLGKGYFFDASLGYALSGWNPYNPTEDMDFGFRAYKRGFTLGVIDRYIRDLCPSDFDTWLTQKKRWVRGPYDILLDPEISSRERIKFAESTLINQLVSIVNIIGLPTGFFVVLFFALGREYEFPLVFVGILAVNLLVWGVYSYGMYKAAFNAHAEQKTPDRVRWFILSNPLTQSIYAIIWTFPIVQAIVDSIRAVPSEFVVTEK
jgi:cellulose synthase/poly-beta-1,6-N-acetylglucosamine synthase-like glycosyltransferase